MTVIQHAIAPIRRLMVRDSEHGWVERIVTRTRGGWLDVENGIEYPDWLGDDIALAD